MSTKLNDYDYFLPEELIGQKPREPRDSSKLMVIDKTQKKIIHKNFYDIIDFLNSGDVLVRNSTKVIPARIFGRKINSENNLNHKLFEILLIKRLEINIWECLVREAKKLKIGDELAIGNDFELVGKLIGIKDDGNRIFEFKFDGAFEAVLDKLGEMPLPPYIVEKLDKNNKDRYQTVYAKKGESIAAPTAGLHFT
ncbi:MAG: S-adenosylmethionine:tRNA ribosyltransferase-isomerase, partial [Fusobacteriaceae bacterium]